MNQPTELPRLGDKHIAEVLYIGPSGHCIKTVSFDCSLSGILDSGEQDVFIFSLRPCKDDEWLWSRLVDFASEDDDKEVSRLFYDDHEGTDLRLFVGKEFPVCVLPGLNSFIQLITMKKVNL